MANNVSSSSSSAGIGFFGCLQILFLALKLTGQIDWSWIWVLSPIWGVFLFYFFFFVGLILWAVHEENKGRRK